MRLSAAFRANALRWGCQRGLPLVPRAMGAHTVAPRALLHRERSCLPTFPGRADRRPMGRRAADPPHGGFTVDRRLIWSPGSTGWRARRPPHRTSHSRTRACVYAGGRAARSASHRTTNSSTRPRVCCCSLCDRPWMVLHQPPGDKFPRVGRRPARRTHARTARAHRDGRSDGLYLLAGCRFNRSFTRTSTQQAQTNRAWKCSKNDNDNYDNLTMILLKSGLKRPVYILSSSLVSNRHALHGDHS